jgi:hypothetical protein
VAKLPSPKDIAGLPRRARVGFAARCARRVLPLIGLHWPEDDGSWWRGVEATVRAAEAAAQRGAHGTRAAAAAAAVARVVEKRIQTNQKRVGADPPSRDAVWEENARLVKVMTVVSAAVAAARGEAQEAVVEALGALVQFFDRLASGNEPDYDAAGDPVEPDYMRWSTAPIAADFRTLRDRVRVESWTDETPVPPEVFGDLWPAGPPLGWPTAEPGAAPDRGGTQRKRGADPPRRRR